MLKAIIVDDESKSRESLQILISDFCQNVLIVGMAPGVKDALSLIEKYSPDIVFLDIHMHKETGFDLLSKIDKINFDVIFTTAHSEYAITAIKFSAVDYLLKPISIDDLKASIQKVEKKRQKDDFVSRFNVLLQNINANKIEDYKLAIPTSDGLAFVRCQNILYCEADGNYTQMYLQDGTKYLVSKTLKDYETLLSGMGFFRIHHSHLINLKEIKKYVRGDGGYVIMSNNEHLDVAKRKKEAFLERIQL